MPGRETAPGFFFRRAAMAAILLSNGHFERGRAEACVQIMGESGDGRGREVTRPSPGSADC